MKIFNILIISLFLLKATFQQTPVIFVPNVCFCVTTGNCGLNNGSNLTSAPITVDTSTTVAGTNTESSTNINKQSERPNDDFTGTTVRSSRSSKIYLILWRNVS